MTTFQKLKNTKSGSISTLKGKTGILYNSESSEVLSHLEPSYSFIEENAYDTYFSPNYKDLLVKQSFGTSKQRMINFSNKREPPTNLKLLRCTIRGDLFECDGSLLRGISCAILPYICLNGIVLLPDIWTLPAGCSFNPGMGGWSRNVYTDAQWEFNGNRIRPDAEMPSLQSYSVRLVR